KLILMFGYDPTIAHNGPGHQFAWYMKMARERGTPVILLDPRYSTAAEVMADQWVPIKPGTDTAMLLAMAYVIFRDGSWNRDFVEKYVEGTGFQKWRHHVMGEEDGVPKTPQWAEAICGVPAPTIEALTRLYIERKPSWLWLNWSGARKSRGENSARAAAALQAMMGYFTVPGGIIPFYIGSWPTPHVTRAHFGGGGKYDVPKICRSHKWAQAILLLDQVKSGQMTEAQWRSIVGYRADPDLPIPRELNPRMLWWGSPHFTASNTLSTACDSLQDQLRALDRMDFIPYVHTTMTPTARYADLILPAMDTMWEGLRVLTASYGGFATVSLNPRIVKPAGEVHQMEWVYTKLAQRLGFVKEFNPYYTNDDNWEA
ncbi:MAG: molybdopterin-dependent oxidoreductase, partial [Chloroflexota bacterium]